MTKPFGNPHACFCGRRADGYAVGTLDSLLWFCRQCGPHVSRKVLKMSDREFDIYERNAVAAAAEAGGEVLERAGKGDVFNDVTPEEWSEMTIAIIRAFSETIRMDIERGGEQLHIDKGNGL